MKVYEYWVYVWEYSSYPHSRIIHSYRCWVVFSLLCRVKHLNSEILLPIQRVTDVNSCVSWWVFIFLHYLQDWPLVLRKISFQWLAWVVLTLNSPKMWENIQQFTTGYLFDVKHQNKRGKTDPSRKEWRCLQTISHSWYPVRWECHILRFFFFFFSFLTASAYIWVY